MLLLISLLSVEEAVFKYTTNSFWRLSASEDGSKWGFEAWKEGKEYVIINSQEWRPYDYATDHCFPGMPP